MVLSMCFHFLFTEMRPVFILYLAFARYAQQIVEEDVVSGWLASPAEDVFNSNAKFNASPFAAFGNSNETNQTVGNTVGGYLSCVRGEIRESLFHFSSSYNATTDLECSTLEPKVMLIDWIVNLVAAGWIVAFLIIFLILAILWGGRSAGDAHYLAYTQWLRSSWLYTLFAFVDILSVLYLFARHGYSFSHGFRATPTALLEFLQLHGTTLLVMLYSLNGMLRRVEVAFDVDSGDFLDLRFHRGCCGILTSSNADFCIAIELAHRKACHNDGSDLSELLPAGIATEKAVLALMPLPLGGENRGWGDPEYGYNMPLRADDPGYDPMHRNWKQPDEDSVSSEGLLC